MEKCGRTADRQPTGSETLAKEHERDLSQVDLYDNFREKYFNKETDP